MLLISIGALIGAALLSLYAFLNSRVRIWICGITLLGISLGSFTFANGTGAVSQIALGLAAVTLFGAAIGTPVRLLQTTIEDGPVAFRRRTYVALGGVVVGIVLFAGVIWLGFGN